MRRLLFAFTAAIALAVGLAQPAAATDQIVTQGTGTDSSVVTDLCAFPVAVETTVTWRNIHFYDEAGNQIRIEGHIVARDTFTANGQMLVGLPYTFHNSITFDRQTGEVRQWFSTGLVERVPLPGGDTFLTAGRVDWTAHPEAWFIIRPDVGAQGNLEGFCAALAP
jgi:hypothetical protein